MGKRRKAKGAENEGFQRDRARREEEKSNREALIDPNSRDYIYDEIDDFEEEQDREIVSLGEGLLPRGKNDKEQVLGLDLDSSDEEQEEEDEEIDDDEDLDDDDDDLDDDDKGEEEEEDSDEAEEDHEDNLPKFDNDIIETGKPKKRKFDDRAWGKNKESYLGTDTSDQMIHFRMYRQSEEIAKVEEETARRLQNRMAAELKDLEADDLIPEDQLEEKEEEEEETEKSKEDKVEINVSRLSRSKKLQLLKTESPEFLPLVEDMKSKCEEIQTFLQPLMKAIDDGYVVNGPRRQYIITKYRLLLNYVSVVSVYMMTKCSQGSVSKHPVVARLAQYRQLLQEMELCDKQLVPSLKQLLSDIENGTAKPIKETEEKALKKKKMLQILSKKIKKNQNKKEEEDEEEEETSRPRKRVSFQDEEEEDEGNLDDEPSTHGSHKKRKHDKKNGKEIGKTLEADEKRGIGYEISKNRGLTPYRKKELVNPRVNYKRKFKKKVTRHRGQVKPMKTEIKRYGGETMGIKAFTVKSRKFK